MRRGGKPHYVGFTNIVKNLRCKHQKSPLMDVQDLPSGRKIIRYNRVEYQSPLLIDENLPSLVTYKCARTGNHVGKVYRNPDGRWWLATCFLNHWMPIEVFSKIEGFLLLNQCYKQRK